MAIFTFRPAITPTRFPQADTPRWINKLDVPHMIRRSRRRTRMIFAEKSSEFIRNPMALIRSQAAIYFHRALLTRVRRFMSWVAAIHSDLRWMRRPVGFIG